MIYRRFPLSLMIALSACGSPTDANEKNFRAALDAHFAEQGDLCLGLGMWGWPKTDGESLDTENGRKLQSLEAVGLLTSRLKRGEWQAAGLDVSEYHLSEASKSFQNKLGDDVCWGKMKVANIVKWYVPQPSGPPAISVAFTYKIDSIVEWANDPNVQAAFAYEIGRVMEGAEKREIEGVMLLTNKGWEVQRVIFGLF